MGPQELKKWSEVEGKEHGHLEGAGWEHRCPHAFRSVDLGTPDLGLLERGLDYRSRHALGLRKSQVCGCVLGLQMPASPGIRTE